MKATCSMAALLLLASVDRARADESANNADYKEWSTVAVHSSYTASIVAEENGVKTKAEMTVMLEERNEKALVVEVGSIVNGSEGFPRKVRYAAMKSEEEVAADARTKGKKTGTEEIEAAGKKWKCEVWESHVNGVHTKQWLNDGFPNCIRAEITSASSKKVLVVERVRSQPRGQKKEGPARNKK